MNIALIVAAGSGSRMASADQPKQFILVKDKPLMIYSLEAFQNHEEIDAIFIVTSGPYINQVKDWCIQYQLTKVRAIIPGGFTRQESVYNGLCKIKEYAKDFDNDIVLIHDAARPLVSKQIISVNISKCKQYDATCTAVQVKDTIARSSNGQNVEEVVTREELYQCQTPQAFKLSLIIRAHDYSQGNATDDAQLVLALHKDVYFVEGDPLNYKITTDTDLLMLKSLLK